MEQTVSFVRVQLLTIDVEQLRQRLHGCFPEKLQAFRARQSNSKRHRASVRLVHGTTTPPLEEQELHGVHGCRPKLEKLTPFKHSDGVGNKVG